MQLVVTCECGKVMVAPREAVGRMGRCPACAKSFLITEQNTRPVDEPADPAVPINKEPTEKAPEPAPEAPQAKQGLSDLLGAASDGLCCPSCGESNSEYATQCWKCGTSLEKEEDGSKRNGSSGGGKKLLKYLLFAFLLAAVGFGGYLLGKSSGPSDEGTKVLGQPEPRATQPRPQPGQIPPEAMQRGQMQHSPMRPGPTQPGPMQPGQAPPSADNPPRTTAPRDSNPFGGGPGGGMPGTAPPGGGRAGGGRSGGGGGGRGGGR